MPWSVASLPIWSQKPNHLADPQGQTSGPITGATRKDAAAHMARMKGGGLRRNVGWHARWLRARQRRAIWHMVCHFASVGSPQAGCPYSLAMRRKPRQARQHE